MVASRAAESTPLTVRPTISCLRTKVHVLLGASNDTNPDRAPSELEYMRCPYKHEALNSAQVKGSRKSRIVASFFGTLRAVTLLDSTRLTPNATQINITDKIRSSHAQGVDEVWCCATI